MRYATSVASRCAVALLCATSAFAQGNAQGNKGEIDPAAVSDGLKAIFSDSSKGTRERLNANSVTIMTGTIGGTLRNALARVAHSSSALGRTMAVS
jgi:hypothetical protein